MPPSLAARPHLTSQPGRLRSTVSSASASRAGFCCGQTQAGCDSSFQPRAAVLLDGLPQLHLILALPACLGRCCVKVLGPAPSSSEPT